MERRERRKGEGAGGIDTIYDCKVLQWKLRRVRSFIPCSREICYIFLLSARPFVKWVGKANRRVMDPTGNCKNWRKRVWPVCLLRLPTSTFNRLTLEARITVYCFTCAIPHPFTSSLVYTLPVYSITRLHPYPLTSSLVFTPSPVHSLIRLLPHPFTSSVMCTSPVYSFTSLLLHLCIATPVYFFIRLLPHPFTSSTTYSITR